MTAQANTPEGAPPSVTPPVAVIGAGPVGLAAAAHLLGRGLDVVVFERAEKVAASCPTAG